MDKDLESKIEKLRSGMQKQTRRLETSYSKFINSHLKDRSIRQIERFVLGWLLVFGIAGGMLIQQFGDLRAHYLETGPAPGGQYIEGVVGSIGTINPIFSDGQVGESATRLIFSSLFQVDSNGQISPDLAESYDLNEAQTVYTVQLRDDVFWHDGRDLTARDVEFTIGLIQDPDVGSHLQLSWQDVEVDTIDDLTVEFTLPNPYAPFLSQLTVGILPEHLLADTAPERVRVASFNQQPVGSGPFEFSEINAGQQIRMRANPNYHFGPPQLERFTIAAYATEEDLVDAYNRNELAGMVLSSTFDIDSLRRADLSAVTPVEAGGQVFAFYNTRNLTDRTLRQALTQSIDTQELRYQLGDDYGIANSPLLPWHLGYEPSQLSYDTSEAREKFASGDFSYQGDELQLDGEPYRLRLVTQDTYSYPAAARFLAQSWEDMGLSVEVVEVDGLELQEEYLRPRNYDVLLFGLGLDIDPDVYAYWHSSQVRDPGRNLSMYNSETVDISLEDGRTRQDSQLRAAKYETFQSQWRRDAPAAALYRLHAYYVSRNKASGVVVDDIAHPIDRFYNVRDWTINTQPIERRLQSSN